MFVAEVQLQGWLCSGPTTETRTIRACSAHRHERLPLNAAPIADGVKAHAAEGLRFSQAALCESSSFRPSKSDCRGLPARRRFMSNPASSCDVETYTVFITRLIDMPKLDSTSRPAHPAIRDPVGFTSLRAAMTDVSPAEAR